jgi:hypothetical protein
VHANIGSVHNNCAIVPYKYAKDVFSIACNLDKLYDQGVIFNDEQMTWGHLCDCGLVDKTVKLPRNTFHVDCYRGYMNDNAYIDRQRDINKNSRRADFYLATYYG